MLYLGVIILKGIDGSLGGIYKREDPHIALWIDDPLRPGVNIGAGSYGMVHVQVHLIPFYECLGIYWVRMIM